MVDKVPSPRKLRGAAKAPAGPVVDAPAPVVIEPAAAAAEKAYAEAAAKIEPVAKPAPTPVAELTLPSLKASAAKVAAEPAPLEPVVTLPAAIKATKPLPVKSVPAKARPVKAAAAPVAPKPKSIVKPKSPKPSASEKPAAIKEVHTMATKTEEMTTKLTDAVKGAGERAKAAFEKSQASAGELGQFAKGNVEAMVESTKILASGLQSMGKDYVADAKTAFETMTADVKELATAKTPTEFFEKQTAMMRKNFDSAVANSSKSSEAMLKLVNEAFQPISNRVSLAIEKVKQAA